MKPFFFLLCIALLSCSSDQTNHQRFQIVVVDNIYSGQYADLYFSTGYDVGHSKNSVLRIDTQTGETSLLAFQPYTDRIVWEDSLVHTGYYPVWRKIKDLYFNPDSMHGVIEKQSNSLSRGSGF